MAKAAEIPWALTFHSDLAVAIAVAGSEESLGLLVAQRSGRGREVLQEQPGWSKGESVQADVCLSLLKVWSSSLQLVLLNEAAVVLVDDAEGLLHVLGTLASQAAFLEESLVLEGVSSWKNPPVRTQC